jgi:hypothetical protein
MENQQEPDVAGEIQEITGIDAERLMEIGLLHPEDAKKWLVKYFYYQMSKRGLKYTDIKLELSDRYFLSVSTIEKLVYRKPRKRSRMRG